MNSRDSASRGVADRLVGATLLLAGVATAVEASTFNVAFLTDPVGPKALPFVVTATLGAAGLSILVRPRGSVALPPRSAAARMTWAALAFLAYATVMPWIGFFLSTVFVVTVLAVLYRGPAAGGLAPGLVLPTALWLLFVRLLARPLPTGALWLR